MELKSNQIALVGVVVRFIDQLIITTAHFLTTSVKDKWLAWYGNFSYNIFATIIIISLFVMLCIDKTKTPAAVLSILFGTWFLTSGLLGAGLSIVLFLLANPMQFAFTFTPAILLIVAGRQYLVKENAGTMQKINELKSKIF